MDQISSDDWQRILSVGGRLRDFDDLPGSAYVRQPVLEGLLSCSASTVWRLVKQGRIPAPRKLGARVTAWRVADLRAALADM